MVCYHLHAHVPVYNKRPFFVYTRSCTTALQTLESAAILHLLAPHLVHTAPTPIMLHRREEVPNPFCVPYNLGFPELALAVQAVDKADWDLADGEAVGSGAHNDLHLHDVAFRRDLLHEVLEHWPAVQSVESRPASAAPAAPAGSA